MFEFLFKFPRDLYARSDLAYTATWPEWLPITLFGIAVAAIAGFLYTRRGRAPVPLLLGVGVLQLAMLLVVLWVLALPALETEELREGENAIALVLDTSGSMAMGDGESRLDAGRRLLETAVNNTADLDFTVRRYEFDAAARAVDDYRSSPASGEQTLLAASLRTVLDAARQTPLAGVIVASDGADTSGGLSTEDLAELAGFGVPVHGIAVGRAVMPEDLELADVTVPARVMPDSTVTARVSIRHDGPAEAQLRVYDRETLLASVPVTLSGDATGSTVNVDFELADAGPHELEFSISGRDETELRNNRRSRLVDVLDDSYRVLYFEGEPRWEYKFMRRALDKGRLELESLLRVSPNKFYRQGIRSPEDLADGFPTRRDQLFAYDALIIGSVEAATLTPDQHTLIRDFVSERGGALLMLGGRNGLGNGGWDRTPVAAALPVRLPDSDSFRRVQVPVELTPQGMDAPMLRFNANGEENRRLWGELPAVADYQLTGELKPAAIVLVNARAESGPIPLLVTQAFGRGRSYVLATGGTWRWQMSLPVEDQRHETFWRQLLRTLVASAPSPVSMTAVAGAGERGIELRAEFRDEAFDAVTGLTVSTIVADAAGNSWSVALQPSASDPGVYQGRIDPGRSGTYYAEAVAARNDAPVSTARASLVYETGQAEHFGIRSNPATLARVANATGGRLLTESELGLLPDLLRFSNAGITETELRPIWDMPAAFLLLLLLKAGEWLLRRRGGSI